MRFDLVRKRAECSVVLPHEARVDRRERGIVQSGLRAAFDRWLEWAEARAKDDLKYPSIAAEPKAMDCLREDHKAQRRCYGERDAVLEETAD